MYSIGLDLGIASVGWAIINDKNGQIMDLGVSLFSAKNSENNLERRDARGARRLLRRRATRLNDAKKLLNELGCYDNQTLKNISPYELRVCGLTEKLTKAELYKAVLHILKKRGISYLDDDAEEGLQESGDYKNQVQLNQTLLETKTPGQIQLQRLKENGRIRTGINAKGEYQLNVFTVDSYANELQQLLKNQQKYYPEITEDYINKFVKKGIGKEAGLIYRKRPYYHGPGNESNPSFYGRWADFNKNGRPAENIFDKLIGKDIQGKLRASASSLSAQKFNLLNDLNNLKLPREDCRVTKEEKEHIINYLLNEEVSRFGANDLAKLLGFSRKEISGWRVDNKDRPEIHSLKIYRDWRIIFRKNGIELNDLSLDVIDNLAKVLTLNTDRESIENTLDLELPNLSSEIKRVVSQNFKELRKKASKQAWHSFSIDTLNLLIPLMVAEPIEQNTALELLHLKKDKRKEFASCKKIPINKVLEEIYNPTVNKTVGRAFHILNELVEKYGKDNISFVTIEMPRDDNEDTQKKTIRNIQKANAKRKSESEAFFLNQSGWSLDRFESELRKRKFAEKLGYYYEQRGVCAYSGKVIQPEELLTNATEIDHVIPLSISMDDSLNNKVLVRASANQEKGQRSPYQAYIEGAKLGRTWSEYESWVKQTYTKKHKRNILLDNRDVYNPVVRETFIQRNLNDTRYASRVVLNTTQSFFYNSPTNVRVITGSFTHTLRKKWGNNLEKTRETHHHHAVDAVLCAVSPFVQIDRFSYYEEQESGNKYMIDTETGEKIPYEEYKKMKPLERKTFVPKWSNFIANLAPTILYPTIKFNHQVDRKANRKISDATIYSTRQVDECTLKNGKEICNEITYIVNKIKDIYTVEGWKEFQKYREKLLAKKNDPQTYAILCEIADTYPDFEELQDQSGKVKRVDRSPFELYRKSQSVEGVRKYAKKGNGPLIRSLKYHRKKLGNHLNISKDDNGEAIEVTKNNKKVVLLSLNPWRTDVYYNANEKSFELVGIKYYHLRFVSNKYGVPREIYEQLKRNEGVSDASEFCFSLYRKDGVVIEQNGERLEALYHSRTKNNRNYFELKPIAKAKWDANEVLPIFGKVSPGGQFVKGLNKDMDIVKFNTDHLGKRYYVTKETLKDIL